MVWKYFEGKHLSDKYGNDLNHLLRLKNLTEELLKY